ncbi:hypothetical protein [Rossellomorea vietnamensis]|uniref:hypothetical protein n=1 Tax=Rossellomorea vietnamensis TaxID=218284 RepID=UPI00077C5155|nr:hypothetical protein [Rossellomorea vietnamensis]
MEQCIHYRSDEGSSYELTTYKGFLKVKKDGKLLLVQNNYCGSQKELRILGFRTQNEIVGSFASYIAFVEQNLSFNGVEFYDDEWEKHTKIFSVLYYSVNGENFGVRDLIGSVAGVMSSTRATPIIDQYEMFIYDKQEPQKSMQELSPTQLANILNKRRELQIY